MAITETPHRLWNENEELVERISWQRAALGALIEENRKLRQTVARLERENERPRTMPATPRTKADRAERVRSMLRASRNP